MSERRSYRTAPQFKAQQRLVGRMGNAALIDSGSIVPATASNERDKYERLGEEYYAQFREKSTNAAVAADDEEYKLAILASPVPQHGYIVFGRLIGYSSRSYQDFCQRTGRQQQPVELGTLLRTDQAWGELVRNMADTSNIINKPQEETYGLTDTTYNRLDTAWQHFTPFVIAAYADDRLYIYPDEDMEQQVTNLTPRNVEPQFTPYERCPGYGVVLRHIWDDMVNRAETDPAYFTADFAA